MDRAYEEGGIYIILTTLDAAANRYHWGIYLCVSDTYGMVYHVTNNSEGGNGRWVFQEHMSDNVSSSRNIVAALQIGRGATNDAADEVHRICCEVPVIEDGSYDSTWGENFTCRVWILSAIHHLRHRGLVADQEARDVQDDAFNLARAATSTGTNRMALSRGLRRRR